MTKNIKLNNNVYNDLPSRVAETFIQKEDNLYDLIKETIEAEKRLVKQDSHRKEIALEKLKLIKSIRNKIKKSKLKDLKDDPELKDELKRLVSSYAEEIHGHFNYFLYGILQRITPIFLNFWLNSFSVIQFFKNFRGSTELKNSIIIRGNTNLIKRLEKFGTLVIVPTHVSNLDSIILAHLIHTAGLRPPLWGAGVNLFKGLTVSYVMNNVGCYKVDRRKKNRLYLETLKEYSTYHLEKGYNVIFYPGGTRSRSGEIEQNLKLGLLNTVVRAFVNNINNGKYKPHIYVVPVTLSYAIVPEAESLALEYFYGKQKKAQILKRIKQKATLFGRILQTIWNVITLNNSISLTLGEPMDPFGNKVNSEGISTDELGIPLDVRNYVFDPSGNVIINDDKIKEYTQALGQKIAESYHKHNTVIPTQVFIYAIVDYIIKKNQGKSYEEIIRLLPEDNIITKAQLKIEVGELIKKLKEMESKGELKLDAVVKEEKIDDIIESGLSTYTSSNAGNAIILDNNKIIPNKLATIWYYSSRIRCYMGNKEEI
jgi:glycerol-3-phosphate O-acyltransferase